MILPLALFLQLQATCAPPATWGLLQKIAATESRFDTTAIHDNSTGQSYRPATLDEAMRTARRLIEAGHNLDLGIMQMNVSNFARTGLTIESAFDPCRSLTAGSEVLGLVSAYNTGNTRAGFENGYVARVVSASGEINSPRGPANVPPASAKASPLALGAKPHQWLAFSDPAEDSWVNQEEK